MGQCYRIKRPGMCVVQARTQSLKRKRTSRKGGIKSTNNERVLSPELSLQEEDSLCKGIDRILYREG